VYIKKKKKYRSKTIDHHLAQESKTNATHTHIRKKRKNALLIKKTKDESEK